MPQTTDDFGPKDGEVMEVPVRMEDVESARVVLALIKRYEHPVSREGVSNDVALQAGFLERYLRTAREAYVEQFNAIGKRWGTLRDPSDEDSWEVKKESPLRPQFNREVRDLDKTVVHVPRRLRIKLSDLKVRDEFGQFEEVRIGRLDDLGDLLIRNAQPETEEAPPQPERGRHRRRAGGGK